MAKRSKPPKVPANPEPETQEKDDRSEVRELIQLLTATINLLIAAITLVILLLKEK